MNVATGMRWSSWRDRPISTDSVEKLDFQPGRKNSSPVDATTCLGYGRLHLAIENSVSAFLVDSIALAHRNPCLQLRLTEL